MLQTFVMEKKYSRDRNTYVNNKNTVDVNESLKVKIEKEKQSYLCKLNRLHNADREIFIF
jgi:hypothetical protein